jgi:hypothetical protein
VAAPSMVTASLGRARKAAIICLSDGYRCAGMSADGTWQTFSSSGGSSESGRKADMTNQRVKRPLMTQKTFEILIESVRRCPR